MNSLVHQCFAEALEAGERRAAAFAVSNNHHAEVCARQERKRRRYDAHIDPRTCGCCGARWGKCEHTSEEAE